MGIENFVFFYLALENGFSRANYVNISFLDHKDQFESDPNAIQFHHSDALGINVKTLLNEMEIYLG